MTRRRLAVLAPLLLALLCMTAAPAAVTTDQALLRRHAPVLVLDAREPGPPVAVGPCLIGEERPRWVASRMRWGASRAALWSPAEQSSPVGPRFQDDGRWRAPAAFHDGARSCAAGPPGHPWWVFALVGGLAAILIGAILRRRASRA